MLKKLDSIKQRYHDINEELMNPETVSDRQKFLELSREHNSLQEIVETYDCLIDAMSEKEECSNMLKTESNSDMRLLLESELNELEEKIDVVLSNGVLHHKRVKIHASS